MTLETIIDRVQNDVLNDPNGATWGDTEIKSWINLAYGDLTAAVEQINEGFFEKTHTFNLVVDKQEYSLPTDFKRMRRVEIKYGASDDNYILALSFVLEEVKTSLTTTALGVSVVKAPGYYLTGGLSSTAYIGFLPIPDEAVTDGGKIWYIPHQTELSSDSGSPQLPDEYHRMLILYAGAKCLQKGNPNNNRAVELLTEYEMRKDQMVRDLTPRRLGVTKRVVATDIATVTPSFDRTSF